MTLDRVLEMYYTEAVPVIRRIFSPQKVLVFGSRVKGTALENSDIDVIIIADFFRDILFVNRAALVMKSVPFSRHVDYLCYTPEEFKRTKDRSLILRDAAAYAVDVTG